MFKRLSGLLLVFVLICLLAFFFKNELAKVKMDYRVILFANALLFVLSVFSLSIHTKALSNSNPNVFVRGVMIANVLKILGLAAAALIYISVAGKATSANAVFASLFLYIIYTWVEKRETIRMSKSRKN